MRILLSALPAFPIVALLVGLTTPRLLVGSAETVWGTQAVHLMVLLGWLVAFSLAMAHLPRSRLGRPASQFSLIALLRVVTLAAVGLAAISQGSVFFFVVLLLLTLVPLTMFSVAAFRGHGRDRLFFRGFALVGWICLSLTLAARSPFTGTPLLRIMWWDVSEWGNGFSPNGASVLAIHYLFLTWLAGYSAAWFLELVGKSWKSRSESRPVV